jgi:hypothetical protein
MNTQRVINQQLRSMTVEVHASDSDRTLHGSAVLLTPEGMLATCAHVVEACGIEPRVAEGEPVLLRFPATRVEPEQWREARVAWFPHDADDDLVLLQISASKGHFLIPPDRVATFGPADDSDYNPFRSFGFRIRGDYVGLFADGAIVSHVSAAGRLLGEPLQLTSPGLDSGMSGAAVLDVDRNLVVGFVQRVYDPAGESSKDPDLAWAVDADVLRHSPVAQRLQTDSLSLQPAVTPEVEPALVTLTSGAREDAGRGHPAGSSVADQALAPPDSLTPFVGREQQLADLDEIFSSGALRVLAIVGEAGQGKTALVREWTDRLCRTPGPPARTFWWTVHSPGHDVDDFLRAFIRHASNGGVDPDVVPTTSARANLAAVLMAAGCHIVVLDGLDVLQADSGDTAGALTSPALLDFLRAVAASKSQSMCIVTSRRDIVDLLHFATFSYVALGALDVPDGQQLLRRAGVEGSNADLAQLVREAAGHPLLLAATAVLARNTGPRNTRRDSADPAAPAGASLVVRLRAIGNHAEAHRPPEERAVLSALSLLRLPIPTADVVAIVVAAFGYDPARVETAVSKIAASAACRMNGEGAIAAHPVLTRLYAVRTRILAPDVLRTLHRACSDYYYRLLDSALDGRDVRL